MPKCFQQLRHSQADELLMSLPASPSLMSLPSQVCFITFIIISSIRVSSNMFTVVVLLCRTNKDLSDLITVVVLSCMTNKDLSDFIMIIIIRFVSASWYSPLSYLAVSASSSTWPLNYSASFSTIFSFFFFVLPHLTNHVLIITLH